MSKFIDVNTVKGNNQIGVIDSGGARGDVRFYNKRDFNDNIRLGFRTSTGEVIMFSSSNGSETVILERFKYSNITEPSSTDLSNLVQQLNAFLYT